MKTTLWNPIRGCHKVSMGCQNCYIELGDKKKGRDFNLIETTTQFDRPIRKNKKGEYVIPSGTLVYTCFSSDFFLEDVDQYRLSWWQMIKERSDLEFLFFTKRIHRLKDVLPADFPHGYEHVSIGVSVENQEMADFRLPHLIQSEFTHKIIVCQPLIGPMNLEPYLEGIDQVTVGGEAGNQGRVLNDDWVIKIRETCIKHYVSFAFRQCGTHYLKDGVTQKIPWKMLSSEARKLNRDLEF